MAFWRKPFGALSGHFYLGSSQEWVDYGGCEFNGSCGGFHIKEQPKIWILIF